MAFRTALALCGVGVRLGVRLVVGRRRSVGGKRDRRIEYDVSHGLPHGFVCLGKSVAVRKIIVK